MPDREEGYYWVRENSDDDWIVAEWEMGTWWIPGTDRACSDAHFEKIDERRIVRELTTQTLRMNEEEGT